MNLSERNRVAALQVVGRVGVLMVGCLSVVAAEAQQVQPAALPTVQATVVVVGTPDPLTEGQSARSTATLEVQPTKLLYNDAQDLLRDDASVDLEERGGAGVQTDVTIRGGSFEQTLVMLNGFRINDAET